MAQPKNNLQTLDNSLFAYGTILAAVVIYVSAKNLEDLNNLILLILFLPIGYYFLTRLSQKIKSNFQSFLNLGTEKGQDHFSFSTFLNQTDTSFLINLFLVCFAIALILLRISLYIART